MREFLIRIGLLWLIGVALRLTLLAVPPVIPLIRAAWHVRYRDGRFGAHLKERSEVMTCPLQ